MKRPSTVSAPAPADAMQVEVDLTLVDAMLARTPEERIRANDRMIRTIEELRHAFQSARAPDLARPPGGERD